MCRSIAEVRRHIFQGDKLKVEIEPMTKTVKRTVVEVVEKRSKKRKGESSLSEKKFAEKKHKGNGHDNYDNIEVENFLKDARNNLMNMDETQRQVEGAVELESHGGRRVCALRVGALAWRKPP
ncbi:hypothetical protein FXO37_11604 [Capsicum annuum]|nr:hypothetical protein FXO37_11604 [Capsicum annuum]